MEDRAKSTRLVKEGEKLSLTNYAIQRVSTQPHSNHTLQCIYDKEDPPNHGVNTEFRSQVARRIRAMNIDFPDPAQLTDPLPPDKIQHLLLLNAQGDAKRVALKKIPCFMTRSPWSLFLNGV